jgi:protein-tyrosine-phosphatase
MADKVHNMLFLCTGNSARSILAECILERAGAGRFAAHSAGSYPTGRVNPHAIELLEQLGHPTENLRSKSWDVFARPGAPVMDFIFTVCDRAAGEVCPIWPGRPVSAHWPFPDPAAFRGPEAETRAHFLEVYRQIEARIGAFLGLPVATLDRLSLKSRLDRIGGTSPQEA